MKALIGVVMMCVAGGVAADEGKSNVEMCKFNGDAVSKLSIHYAKGILKNRFHYFNEKRFYSELGDVSFSDKELNYLIEKARVVSSPTDFIILAAEVISCR